MISLTLIEPMTERREPAISSWTVSAIWFCWLRKRWAAERIAVSVPPILTTATALTSMGIELMSMASICMTILRLANDRR